MNMIITAKNFELTDGIKLAIQNRLYKFGEKVNATEMKALLEVKKYGQKIEVIIPVNGMIIKAEETSKDLYDAIEAVAEKLKYQVNKYLKKLNEKKNISIRYFDIQDNDTCLEPTAPAIVRRKPLDIKPMSEEEAILQMELLGHHSFLFFNSDLDCICMLYKRKDGNYGLIEGRYL